MKLFAISNGLCATVSYGCNKHVSTIRTSGQPDWKVLISACLHSIRPGRQGCFFKAILGTNEVPEWGDVLRNGPNVLAQLLTQAAFTLALMELSKTSKCKFILKE